MTIIDTYLYSESSSTEEINIASTDLTLAPYRYSVPSATTAIQVGVILQQVAAPIITPAGGIISNNLYATITCSTPGATIYMTLNGEDPSLASMVYAGAFLVDRSLTIKAMAVKSGMADSNVTVTTYSMVVNTVATPTITPDGGNFNVPVTVSLNCDTVGADIYYTTNGTTPSVLSTRYTVPFILSNNTLVRAVGVKTGLLDSAVVAANFSVFIETKVAAPQLTPGAGIFADPVSVVIGTSTPGAALYYTLDGSTPSSSSSLYSAPVPINNNTTLKVVGVRDGIANSDIVTAQYIIQSTSKPINVVAINNDQDIYGTSARLSWQMTSTVGLSGFKIVYGTSSGSYAGQIIVADPFVFNYTVNGLTTNTTYYFAISAMYGSLESQASTEVSCYIEDVVKPAAPTNFVASITADGKGVWLRWVNPTQDFSHVVLVKNADRIPASPTDGEQIYTGTAQEYTDRDI